MAPSTVLVTGVSRFPGSHLAMRCAANPAVKRVIGVDAIPPAPDALRNLGRAEFVLADIRNPLIVKVMADAQVDTVVHTSIDADLHSRRNRAALKEMNVIGTMQLLAACQRSTSVRKLVVKSTTAIYGASPRDPALFTEDMTAKSRPSTGYARDAVEIEDYVRAFQRRRPEVNVTVLRFTHVIGPQVDTVLTRYFALPVIPTMIGYDSRMQLLHSADALAVLERATLHDLPGIYNVGGAGILMLSQAIRRAGRIALPIPDPLMPMLGRAMRSARVVGFPLEQLSLRNIGQVVDTTALRSRFGYQPQWSTSDAFDDYVRGGETDPAVSPSRLVGVEARILDFAAKFSQSGRSGDRV